MMQYTLEALIWAEENIAFSVPKETYTKCFAAGRSKQGRQRDKPLSFTHR